MVDEKLAHNDPLLAILMNVQECNEQVLFSFTSVCVTWKHKKALTLVM